MAGMLSTPRPVPGRRVPVLAGSGVIAVALPIFLIAGWNLGGWGLAAVLWLAVHALDHVVARARTQRVTLAASGVQVFAVFFKSIGLLVVLFAALATDRSLALGAVATYALAYTCELGLSLVAYFGAEK
jgi:hypothetical protein